MNTAGHFGKVGKMQVDTKTAAESDFFKKPKTSTIETQSVAGSSSELEPKKKNQLMNLRVLTGDIQQITKWYGWLDSRKDISLYEVIAPIVNSTNGNLRHQNILLLRGSSGPVLKVVYYVHDMVHLPNLKMGQTLRCVGRMLDRQTLQAFSIRKATPDETVHLARLAYVCEVEVLRCLESRKRLL